MASRIDPLLPRRRANRSDHTSLPAYTLNQEQGMSIQAWHTQTRLNYQKCDFPSAAVDRLQRDIFVIGLNETFKRFRNDIISGENFTFLTFSQVVAKARDY